MYINLLVCILRTQRETCERSEFDCSVCSIMSLVAYNNVAVWVCVSVAFAPSSTASAYSVHFMCLICVLCWRLCVVNKNMISVKSAFRHCRERAIERMSMLTLSLSCCSWVCFAHVQYHFVFRDCWMRWRRVSVIYSLCCNCAWYMHAFTLLYTYCRDFFLCE